MSTNITVESVYRVKALAVMMQIVNFQVTLSINNRYSIRRQLVLLDFRYENGKIGIIYNSSNPAQGLSVSFQFVGDIFIPRFGVKSL